MTADTDRLALLAAVCADPGDDAPRFAFADWLEEHGEADRAEFIRVQCELSQREADGRDRSECSWGGTCCCRSHALRRREGWLLDTYEAEWIRDLPEPFHRPCGGPGAADHTNYDFRRGFVEWITCTAADFLAHGRAAFMAHPVTDVHLLGVGPVRLTADPALWAFTASLINDPDLRPVGIWDSEDAARAALSALCVAWGREQVGLPPLHQLTGSEP